MDELTERERQVLELLACRESDLDIASRLHISPQTVHTHVRNIFGKLGVNSRKALTGIDIPERD
jgi:two-component system, NarL family, response regulator YdfI